MHFGFRKHTDSPEDLMLLYCKCGWHSEELNREQVQALGIPWYCGSCRKVNLYWVKFHPSERMTARRIACKEET